MSGDSTSEFLRDEPDAPSARSSCPPPALALLMGALATHHDMATLSLEASLARMLVEDRERWSGLMRRDEGARNL